MRFEPQRLFGWLEMALHAHPVLTPTLIREAISAYPRLLGGSDLASQIERIKITPHPLSMDDFSKMWSVFLHIPYLLSATYRTSVVLITPEQLPPPPALPVLERRIHLLPFDEPVIESIQPQTAPPRSEIIITGRNFTLDGVLVDFPTQSVHVRPERPDQIALSLPDDLPAGITSVTVTTEYNLGTEGHPEPRSVYTSNVAAFVLRPLLQSVHYEPIIPPQIVARTDPAVHPAQSVTLWLYESVTPAGGTPRIYGLQPLHHPATTDLLRFVATAVTPGTYIARLRVDGAESSPGPYDRVVVP
jgi:hypothetical protein